jgi:hypothetical protein
MTRHSLFLPFSANGIPKEDAEFLTAAGFTQAEVRRNASWPRTPNVKAPPIARKRSKDF